MAESVFLDTVGLIAVLNRDDEYHRSAATVFTRIGETGRTVVTTNLVLGELGNGLARTPLREEVGWLIRQLHTDPVSTVVHVDRQTCADGVDLYIKRGAQSRGSVDWRGFVRWRCWPVSEGS